MKKLFIMGIALLTIWSCENLNDSSVKLLNYLPMKVGNYWVYQHFRVDSMGVETKLSMYDSVAIMGDTMINSKKYFVFYQSNPPVSAIPSFVRDSSGSLLNDKNEIFFSQTNFKDTLMRSTFIDNNIKYFDSSIKMEKAKNLVSVPMGNYEALNAKGTLLLYIDLKNDIPYVGINIPVIYYNTYYAPNVGLILDTYIYLSQYKTRYERRLIRYKIN